MKTLKQILNREDCGYPPNTKDEKRFIDKHKVKTYGDDATAKSKTKKAPKQRGAYDAGEDKRAYEAVGDSNINRKAVLKDVKQTGDNMSSIVSKDIKHYSKKSTEAYRKDKKLKRSGVDGNEWHRREGKHYGDLASGSAKIASLYKNAAKVVRKEETDLQELSKKTLKSYAGQANISKRVNTGLATLSKRDARDRAAPDSARKNSADDYKYHTKQAKNREDGIKLAKKKLSGMREAVGVSNDERKAMLKNTKQYSKAGAAISARNSDLAAKRDRGSANAKTAHVVKTKDDREKTKDRGFAKEFHKSADHYSNTASLRRNASKVVHKDK